jgi:hydrogenase maturation factor
VKPDQLLPPGKLPAPLLKTLIEQYVAPHPSVVVGPGTGRDAAAIDFGDRILVVKTDPITFATTDAGYYLVNVNANDIACMGATPRWLLVTALLPERSTTPALVEELFASLARSAEALDIALVGGHSEITIGLDRPMLIGQMLGECLRAELLLPSDAQPGDAIVLTGGIAIEGTAILASDAADSLIDVHPDILETARNFLYTPGISVLPAVDTLREAGIRPRYLHDPTEGGLATALAELSEATGHGVHVFGDAIPLLPETQAVCAALDLDPLGLIASGALLAVVADEDTARALAALQSRGLRAARIGVLCATKERLSIERSGAVETLPRFQVDEIARYFSSAR